MRLCLSLLMALFMLVSASAQTLAPQPSTTYGPSVTPMAPSPSNDCFSKLLNMSDCLSYVTAGSNVTLPDKPCCPELAGLVESNPICLCDLLGQSSSYGLKIDLNRALKLPSVCNVTTPPVSLCSVVGVGVPSLSPSEGPPPVSAQTLAPQPSAAFGPSATPMGPSAMGPSPSDDCLNKLLNMSDCLSYVTAGSNVTVPDKPCCPELAGLVESNPICLCDLLGDKSSNFGINIDLKRALKLPSVCNVTTPPVSLCSVVGAKVPSSSPSPSPTEGSPPGSGASSMEGCVLAVLVGLVYAFLI